MKPAAAKAKAHPLAAIVDELGTLEKRARNFKAAADRIELLRKQLRASMAGMPPDARQNIYGKQYTAVLGECGLVRTVNTKKLASMISGRAFAELATVTLAALTENEIAPEVCAAVIDSYKTGPRKLDIIEAAVQP